MQETADISINVNMENIETILGNAVKDEKNHQISQAVSGYESILEFISNLTFNNRHNLTNSMRKAFIAAVQRRTAISVSYFPRRKKIIDWLFQALEMAIYLGDIRSQASLELFISQTYWLSFQARNAEINLNKAYGLIQQLNDDALNKHFLRLRALAYLCEGQLPKAIETYESSIGNIESLEDDFSLFPAYNIALVYTEIGAPQRGIGICDTIRTQCKKKQNDPMLCFSFFLEGLIHFEIRHLHNSRWCLEKALQIAKEKNLLAYEILSNSGLVCIEYLEGNLNSTSAPYTFVRNMPRFAWYYLPHYYTIFDILYTVYAQSKHSFKDQTNFDFLNRLNRNQTPLHIHQMLERVEIVSNENSVTTEQIESLRNLEQAVEQNGSTFELAKIRIELARRYDRIEERRKAENYAKQAWSFLQPIASEAYPEDLRHLLPADNLSSDERLSDLVIEMGKALTRPDNIEQLLTNIISSIAQMTKAERTAIFINVKDSSEIVMAASRNLLKEEVLDKDFQAKITDIQHVAQSGKSKITHYAPDDSEVFAGRQAVITPVMLGNKSIGVLYQDSRFFSLDPSPEKIEILSALSSQIALAIDRAQAYDEIAELNKKLIEENLYYLNEKEEFRPFNEIIGTSKAILDVQHLIRKVAPTQSAVMINGETGVGKELVARAIHRESPRKDHPFIRVNCAALPDSLIDSELFGHERGAFTGALKTKAGRFELAHQGTIFLDEVSELPLSTQSRLLRVLQEKEFQRVGGTKTLYSDFRLITATNKDLKKEVAEGRFREDLFYRLNVYPIYVPPLRERKADIPLLAMHFLKLFSLQCNKNYTGITEAELEKLSAHNWPGNIRELSNMIERAVIAGEGKIRFPELEHKYESSPADGNLNLKKIEETTILEALKRSNGKVGGKNGAAELLGLERHTLLHRMKKLSLKVESYRLIRKGRLA